MVIYIQNYIYIITFYTIYSVDKYKLNVLKLESTQPTLKPDKCKFGYEKQWEKAQKVNLTQNFTLDNDKKEEHLLVFHENDKKEKL